MNLFKNRAPTFEMLNLLRQLSTLVSAGVALMNSLELLMQSHHTLLLQRLAHELEAGQPFYQALQKSHLGDALTCRLVQIGEETGTLDLMLNRIVAHKENEWQWQQKLNNSSSTLPWF